MPKKKYFVNREPDERKDLLAMTKSGKVSARKLNRVHILLQADDGADDKTTASSLHIGTAKCACHDQLALHRRRCTSQAGAALSIINHVANR